MTRNAEKQAEKHCNTGDSDNKNKKMKEPPTNIHQLNKKTKTQSVNKDSQASPTLLTGLTVGDMKEDSKPGELNMANHCVFQMSNGHEIVSGTDNIEKFQKEWEDFSLRTYYFQTKEEAKAFANSLNPTYPTTPIKKNLDSNGMKETIAASSQAKLNEVLATMQKGQPGNRINIMYRSGSASTACVVLIQCLSNLGRPQWNVKPDFLSEPIRIFPAQFPEDPDAIPVIEDDIVATMFYKNFIYRKQSQTKKQI